MTVPWLGDEIAFPPPDSADETGLLAAGGDLRPERLVAAYSSGIFPWPMEGCPLTWFSPDPRFVLRLADLRVSRSLRSTLRRRTFEVRFDTACRRVIESCATVERRDGGPTWIEPPMIAAYSALHDLGFVHSAEAWRDGELVGGLYGVSVGAAFIGESMFARVSDASKVAFVALARQLEAWGFHFLDAQTPSEHLASLGATAWPRAMYLESLEEALQIPTRLGPWTLEIDPAA